MIEINVNGRKQCRQIDSLKGMPRDDDDDVLSQSSTATIFFVLCSAGQHIINNTSVEGIISCHSLMASETAT